VKLGASFRNAVEMRTYSQPLSASMIFERQAVIRAQAHSQ
jgi:hypothetical protein